MKIKSNWFFWCCSFYFHCTIKSRPFVFQNSLWRSSSRLVWREWFGWSFTRAQNCGKRTRSEWCARQIAGRLLWTVLSGDWTRKVLQHVRWVETRFATLGFKSTRHSTNLDDCWTSNLISFGFFLFFWKKNEFNLILCWINFFCLANNLD